MFWRESDLYILGITKLLQQLASDELGEKQAFHYYLATAILSALTYEAVANSPGSGGTLLPVDYLDGVLETCNLITGPITRLGIISGFV